MSRNESNLEMKNNIGISSASFFFSFFFPFFLRGQDSQKQMYTEYHLFNNALITLLPSNISVYSYHMKVSGTVWSYVSFKPSLCNMTQTKYNIIVLVLLYRTRYACMLYREKILKFLKSKFYQLHCMKDLLQGMDV